MEQTEHPLSVYVTIRIMKHKSGYTATVDDLPEVVIENKKYKHEAIDEAAEAARKVIYSLIRRS